MIGVGMIGVGMIGTGNMGTDHCAIVAAAAVQALDEGARVRIALPARLAFYDLAAD